MSSRFSKLTAGLILLGGAPLACSSQTPDTTSPAETRRATLPLSSGAFSDDAFRTAAGCATCSVLAKAPVNLPLTGVTAVSAKLFGDNDFATSLTLLSNGTVAREADLVQAENAAARAQYGSVSLALQRRIAASDPSSRLWIAIWQKVPSWIYRLDRAALADPTAMASYRAALTAVLKATSTPVLNALAAMGATVPSTGTRTPLILASVAPSDIPVLAAMSEVAQLDIANWPERLTSYVWYSAIDVADAHGYGSGAGQNICNDEGYQPDNYAPLNVSGVLAPNGPTSEHTTWTSGIMKNIDNPVDSVSPNANMYIGNNDGATWWYDVTYWCTNTMGARSVNHSAVSDGGAPGPSTVVDWTHDWVALNWPYPLYVSSAGNDGTIAGADTVQNRYYNGLLVGGSDTKQTNSVSDDTVWGGNGTPAASWRNFQTTHNDYELPHIMAPADYPISSSPSLNQGNVFAATSAAAPQVTGSAALVTSIDANTFQDWPEMVKAVLLVTAINRLDAGYISGLPITDSAAGAGLLSTWRAATLSLNQWWYYPGKADSVHGRYRSHLDFSTDFHLENLKSIWNQTFTTGPIASGRLRVVIAWDATPGGCAADGANCTQSILDGDLDLYLYDNNTFGGPQQVASSVSYDGSWGMIDFQPIYGHSYTIKVGKWATSAPGTYLGIAWYDY